jgi:endonuclease III
MTTPAELAKNYGKLYSEELGIKLQTGKEQEIFKWFFAALLFGKPIQENVAKKTYQLFALKRITTPQAILDTGWGGLVEILDLGGYVRYDFSTATKLLEIMKQLQKEYGGKVANIHAMAKDARDLELRLQQFKGIGTVTANIFLRELRTVWNKADPEPAPMVKEAARRLNITLPLTRKSEQFMRLEAALVRVAKLRKRRITP